MKTLLNPADADEVLARMEKIRPETSRRWGMMTAHQMVCHLSDGYRLYMGLKRAEPVDVPAPRWLIKWVALWVPRQWPQGFKSAPELDQQTSGTRPTAFDDDMRELRALANQFTRLPRDFSWPTTHPHFGPMTERDWMRLGYLHADHHLRQFGA